MNGRSHSERGGKRPAKPGAKKGAAAPLRERIRETTVQAIMEAAEEVFADQGLHGAHMGEIAARAGVAVGTLYNHFQDREALLEGLLDARGQELLARIDGELAARQGRPFRERLHALLSSVLEHKQAHRKFFNILLQGEVGRYHLTFPSASHKPSATMKEVFARVERVIKQGVQAKQIRPETADLAPILFVGIVRAISIHGILAGTTLELPAQTDRLIDLFLNGAGQ
jgi:AcrR family transcriptional regulator